MEKRMIKDNILVRKLVGIETSGNINILFTDKTGTLTQNKMTVLEVYTKDGLKKIEDANNESEIEMLNYFTLCSDAQIKEGQEIGDPTEIALVAASLKKNYTKEMLYSIYTRGEELSFDSDRKMMTVFFEKPFWVGVFEHIDNLRLNGYVKSGYRFITN